MYRLRLTLILVLASTSSCTLFHKSKPARVFVPPPVKPVPTAQEVPQLPPAPDVESEPYPEGPPVSLETGLPPASPPPAPRRPAPPRAVVTPAPAPVPEPTPTPRLETILTAEQLREYNRTLDESLDRVKKILERVAGQSLKPDLRSTVSRIQTFQKQAEQARESDLVTAVNLARRADLLAQDLIRRLP
jgi:hypothetical protein